MTNDTYLTDKQLAERYKVGRATPWRWAQDTDFPKPIKLTPGCTRWKLADIEQWESERKAANA